MELLYGDTVLWTVHSNCVYLASGLAMGSTQFSFPGVKYPEQS